MKTTFILYLTKNKTTIAMKNRRWNNDTHLQLRMALTHFSFFSLSEISPHYVFFFSVRRSRLNPISWERSQRGKDARLCFFPHISFYMQLSWSLFYGTTTTTITGNRNSAHCSLIHQDTISFPVSFDSIEEEEKKSLYPSIVCERKAEKK